MRRMFPSLWKFVGSLSEDGGLGSSGAVNKTSCRHGNRQLGWVRTQSVGNTLSSAGVGHVWRCSPASAAVTSVQRSLHHNSVSKGVSRFVQ